MTNYYCVVAGLPDLSLDDGKLTYTVDDFKAEILPLLTEKDRRLVELFYLKFDNADLLRLLRDKDATTEGRGNYTADELRAVINAAREGDAPDKRYPAYLHEFATAYLAAPAGELTEARAEDMLAARYYAYAMHCGNPFVAAWFEFSLNVNNLLAAFTARKYRMDVPQAVVGQTEVCEAIRTSTARDFGLADTLDYFEPVLHISETDELLERERKTDELRWQWMDDAVFFHYFSVERIFVFLQKLEMIERWIAMDKDKGNERFRQLIARLKDEVRIPDEFRK